MGEEVAVALPLSDADRTAILKRLRKAQLDVANSSLPKLVDAVQRELLVDPAAQQRLTNMGLTLAEDAMLESSIDLISGCLETLLEVVERLSEYLPSASGKLEGQDGESPLAWAADSDPFEIAVLRLGLEHPDADSVSIVIDAVRSLARVERRQSAAPDLIDPMFRSRGEPRDDPSLRAVRTIMRFRRAQGLSLGVDWHYGDRAGGKGKRRTDDELPPLTNSDCTVWEVARAFGLQVPNRTLRRHMVTWKKGQKWLSALAIGTGPVAVRSLAGRKRNPVKSA